MVTDLATAALFGAIAVFAVAEIVVFWQILRDARKGRSTAASWTTQTAWALVPLLMLGALLLATRLASPAKTGRPAPVEAATVEGDR